MTQDSDQTRLRRFIDERLTRDSVVIWDFDGVVADTEPIQARSYRELGRRQAVLLRDDYFLDLVGRTEVDIWTALETHGVDSSSAARDGLRRERTALITRWATEELRPSWLAARWMPEFADRGIRQFVVSNGDPDFIATLLEVWALGRLVAIARRLAGTSKESELRRVCVPPALVFEDNAGWLRLARELGASTIVVRHRYNADADFHGTDLQVSLSGSES